MGTLTHSQGRWPEAERVFAEGYAAVQKLTEGTLSHNGDLILLALAALKLAAVKESAGKSGEADRLFTEGAAAANRYIDADPTDVGHQLAFAAICEGQGRFHTGRNQPAKAESLFSVEFAPVCRPVTR